MTIIRYSQGGHGTTPGVGGGAQGHLPDFRNLGVVLRLTLLVNGLALAAALARNGAWSQLPAELAELAARVEPPLLFCLLFSYALQPRLAQLPYRQAALLLLAAALAGSVLTGVLIAPLVAIAWGRLVLWTGLLVGVVLWYFNLHERALAPALAEARLMALTARIRPHFLFNCLNGVLGIIRVDARRAERALEEMSDLFRALMRENRELVSLGDEIALARQYLALEKLRLGDRLQVRWDMDSCPPDARVPPLMLQPLLENAVRHGIEAMAEPGEILARFSREDEKVVIVITNPLAPGLPSDSVRTGGNHMALDNIRERLMLFFDLEAQLTTSERDGVYQVLIRLPYRPGA